MLPKEKRRQKILRTEPSSTPNKEKKRSKNLASKLNKKHSRNMMLSNKTGTTDRSSNKNSNKMQNKKASTIRIVTLQVRSMRNMRPKLRMRQTMRQVSRL
jgi:hypothetical protein